MSASGSRAQFWDRTQKAPGSLTENQRHYIGSADEHGDPRGALSMSRQMDTYHLNGQSLQPPEHLFSVYQRATPWTVDTMAVAPGHESHVPGLLGLAAVHSLKTTGRLPEPSNDLSEHSERMVSHLVERGVIDPPRMDVLHNDISKREAQRMVEDSPLWYYSPLRHVPRQESDHASRVTRALLRRPKDAPEPPRQGRLF